jgi:hypothetical protein
VLNLVDESSDVGEQLDGEFVAGLDELLGLLGSTDPGRGTGQNDGTGGQSGALGEEADQLRDAEDQVTGGILSAWETTPNTMRYAYVKGQSCMTRPFFRPRIWNLLASGIRAAETRTGPASCMLAVTLSCRIKR